MNSDGKLLDIAIKATALIIAILSATCYVTGWLYRTSYLAEFGIPPLNEALHSYLLASWAILFAALVIVIVVGYAGMAVIRTKREGTSPSKRSLVAVLVSGIALAIALWLLAAGNDSEVLSWPMLIFLLALLAFCVVLFWRSKKPYYLIMLILVAEMLLFLSSLHLGIQDAQSHLALDRSKFSIPPRTLAIVTVNTKAPLDHGTPPSTECPCLYRNLRLVAFQDNLYYLFDPQAQAKGNPPSTYVIPLDNILYLVVEPASVPMTTTLPVATSAVTNTQFVSPTMAVPAPIPLPSQSPIP